MFAPIQLGAVSLDKETVKLDRKRCSRFGPCGVGEKALYLNTFFLDRRLYVPLSSVRRAFKRVAMTKGGFSGKGVFGSMPYLVVEYDDGKQTQCNFKHEEDVDRLLAHLAKVLPEIPLHSAAAERRLRERDEQEAKRYLATLTPAAEAARKTLEQAKAFLEQEPEITNRLAAAAKAKRTNDRTNPAYKWVALVIVIAGIIAAAFGVQKLFTHDTTGIYFTLLGLAGILMFSSAQVLPTARNNRKVITQEWEAAKAAIFNLVGEDFPVPYWYAHPIVLQRMIRVLREGRAQSVDEALSVVKTDLKALTADVQVEQEEYDEVVVIKPMFLLQDYQ